MSNKYRKIEKEYYEKMHTRTISIGDIKDYKTIDEKKLKRALEKKFNKFFAIEEEDGVLILTTNSTECASTIYNYIVEVVDILRPIDNKSEY
jgi:hypothetical protein